MWTAAMVFAADPKSPDNYIVDFHTDVDGGVISVNVTRAWAPLGSDRFYALVKDSFFDKAAFFRVVPDFVVQFGIAGTPEENTKWSATIVDDPVLQSNLAGTLVYATAGPDTRTTELFINYVDNTRLDQEGFAPFGQVIEKGLEVATAIHNPTPGNTDGVNQDDYLSKGNTWIEKKYPDINFIVNATIRQ